MKKSIFICLIICLTILTFAYAIVDYANYASYCNFTTMEDGVLTENSCQKGAHSPQLYSSQPIINNGSLYINVTGSGNPAHQWAMNMTGSTKSDIMSCEGDFVHLEDVGDTGLIFDWFDCTTAACIGGSDAFRTYISSTEQFVVEGGFSIGAGILQNYHYKMVVDDNNNNGYVTMYYANNRTLYFNLTTPSAFTSGITTWDMFGFKQNDQGKSRHFSFYCYNGTLDLGVIQLEASPPSLTSINVTSGEECFNLDNETNEPCILTDSTPTLQFITDEDAWCRMSNSDQGYTAMSTDCSSGQGNVTHICTWPNEFAKGSVWLYIACNDTLNNFHSAPLPSVNVINFTIVGANESDGKAAITLAVNNALTGYTSYTDQQAYIRTSSNNQTLGNYDKLIAWESQRWLLEYITGSDSYTNAPDLGRTVIVWENESLFAGEIIAQVGTLINSTKSG